MASKARKKAVGKSPVVPPAETIVSEGRSWLWAKLFAAALILAGIAYLPSLNAPPIFDDHSLPFSDPKAARMPAGFWIGGVRPMLMATYWLNYKLSGTETLSYHVVNLLLHAASAVVVFFLLQQLLKLAAIERNAFLFSLVGGGYFSVAPPAK